MSVDRNGEFIALRRRIEISGFVFEKEQSSHMQSKRGNELKFVHPELDEFFKENGTPNNANKYYIKKISDEIDSEIGLMTGKSTQLTKVEGFHRSNAIDSFGSMPAWINKPGDESLELLLVSIDSCLGMNRIDRLEDDEISFHEAVRESLNESAEARQQRVRSATKIPAKKIVRALSYRRNPDVVAEVLMRANGICEICGRNAPFIRKRDHTPFLEIHHKTPLSEGGEDTTDNAVGICPNCHREQHFG